MVQLVQLELRAPLPRQVVRTRWTSCSYTQLFVNCGLSYLRVQRWTRSSEQRGYHFGLESLQALLSCSRSSQRTPRQLLWHALSPVLNQLTARAAYSCPDLTCGKVHAPGFDTVSLLFEHTTKAPLLYCHQLLHHTWWPILTIMLTV